jgi:hypothetical protein
MAQARQRRAGCCVSVCLASAGVFKALPVVAFTLVWTHSVEKIDWQEDWRVTSGKLQLTEARVKGTGAGMEPPPEARLVDGWWRWVPTVEIPREVVLGNSGAAGEWRFCIKGACRTLSDIFGRPVGAHATTMRACDLEHDPKKWKPVFGKDHAQTRR